MKIYFDMDGVLADFDRGIIELCNMTPRVQEPVETDADSDMWEAVRDVGHFYDKLQMMPGAKELFDYACEISGGNCEILTGIPKPKRGILTAGEDKTNWIRRLISKDVKVNIVFKEDKKNYCNGPEDVLIDDFDVNINAWIKNGGTGILFKSAEQTINELKKL